ncbi:precorrin-3B synthase [Mycobacterium sp.]|uniref:precorrin-3B synthase n=1 Tax=Mycobacterium sp. TaxID=1785 RepID=UPI003C70CCD5
MFRTRDVDACPGALSLHRAADGSLARIRLPGGAITPAQLQALARAAKAFGSPDIELTSRGNIQIRAITDEAAVAQAVAAAGLLPSATHEKVRNIVASPLSGRVGDHPDVRAWVAELDAAIQASPVLASVGGRFWFGIDDGRGDVSGLAPDVGVHVLGDSVALLLAGRDTGVRLPCAETVTTLVAVAARFTAVRGKAWRVSELDGVGPLLDALPVSAERGATWPPAMRPPVGWLVQNDGRVALGAAVPLGVLAAGTAESLAAIEAPMVVTPWRSVLVCDLDEAVADMALRVLAPTGLVFDENSPWLSVSACTGSPGCEHSRADVRADAANALEFGGAHRHYVGCERACGSRPGDDVLVATGDGYRRLPS